MKAVIVTRYGGPDVLEMQDVREPEPGPSQVAINVTYAGLNFAEVMAREGAVPALKPPFIPGLEVTGTVHAIGKNVEGFSRGDRVSALTVSGGYAEVALASARNTYPLARLADRLTGPEAAALPTIVPTALAICELARIGESDTVMVQAAAGGVGSVVGQVARALGAGTLIGVVGTDAKSEAAKSFGYDHVVLRNELAERVLEITHGRGADVILDSVGGARRRDALALLAPGGRLVAYGNASGEPEAELPSATLRTANQAVLGFSITALSASAPETVHELTNRALKLVEARAIQVFVSRTFHLDDVRAAHELLGRGKSTGKLVLQIGR
jgi:NADPH2:quinone reductase